MANMLTVLEGQEVSPLKWFMFNQNNSGGWFDIRPEEGIGETVWVQARNVEEANARAQVIGLYFDGCEKDRDCDCCGDRWSEAWGNDEGTFKEPYIWADWRKEAVFAHRYDGTFYQVTGKPEIE